MTHQVIIPDDYPAAISGTEAEARLRATADVSIHGRKASSEDDLIGRVRNSHVILNIRAYTNLSRTVLKACPHLGLISVWGTGTDNVDLEAAKELDITVTNTPGANALSVAEHTMAILLALVRQIPRVDRGVRSGEWPRVEMIQLSGKVMGLLGLGAIGAHVARIAKGLGMDVIAWTRQPSPERAAKSGVRFVSREEVIGNADVVSLHLRLNEQTKGFFKLEDFASMKPTAFFVNTARAGLVEAGALNEALRSKRIAGAALDVYDTEPLPAEDPITAQPKVVLTPHNAGMTPEATMTGLLMAVENVARYLEGGEIEPEHVVVNGNRKPHP
jgi:phosphoglycerate dehydrogenase-like enzyme